MATRTGAPQAAQQRRARQRGLGELGHHVLLAGLDMNATGIAGGESVIDVREWNRLTIECNPEAGASWATAVVEVKRSAGTGNYSSFTPVQELTAASPRIWSVDVSGAALVALDVTTAEGGALTGQFTAYVYNEEPFGQPDGFAQITPVAHDGDGALHAVTGTATGSATTVATATAATAGGEWDLWTLEACNTHTADVLLTVEVIDTSHLVQIIVPFNSGMFTVLEEHQLRNAKTLKVFAAVANVIFIHAFRKRVNGGLES